MVRWLLSIVAGVIVCVGPGAATAQHLSGCSIIQSRMVEDAVDTAKDLALQAAVEVGDTPQYRRWFGEYSQSNAEQVRATLKAIVAGLRRGRVQAICQDVRPGECEDLQFAYVFPGEPYAIYVCPNFFSLPVLSSLRPGDRRSDFGTREGTIIHEMSHFTTVALTEDHCYSRAECSEMAINDPRRAIENADSYQYFTEDVTHFARQPIVGKPAAEPRADRP